MGPRLPKLRVVSNYGVGVDHIDVEAARRLNIPVGNTPHVLNGATADQAMTLLLAAGRAVVIQSSNFRDHSLHRAKRWETDLMDLRRSYPNCHQSRSVTN